MVLFLRRFSWLALLTLLAALVAWNQRAALWQWAFDLTGEEQTFSQVLGLWQLATDALRPPLDLRADVPIQHNGVNPFGINTFLQHEVEPAKRERQVQLIADAGFYWLRQEFPWYDIEISGKGNFDDCRHGPCVSAWEKYDQIVDLADRSGLQLIARLSSPPDWSRADGAARGAFAPPDRLTDFADFAAAVAQRYHGRIRYFQIWNEPNGNAEWGYQPVDPEAYTRLLCETYTRLKAVDPDNVILAAALTPTNELQGALDTGATHLNDLIFLQRMYNAGAQGCFDVMSAQGYGLYSGPTDRRNRAIIVNYGRNQFIRDLMVKNGDAHKALWIAEMNWNTVPDGLDRPFGQVTPEQQARYVPLAYERAQAAWPWVGVNAFWFFKRADDSEKNQPWYYFRMADPDFTLQPVYYSAQAYTAAARRMHSGWYQEDHWAVDWDGAWAVMRDPRATFGAMRVASVSGARAEWRFVGQTALLMIVPQGVPTRLALRIDGATRLVDVPATGAGPISIPLAQNLADDTHTVSLALVSGQLAIDGFRVARAPDRAPLLLVGLGVVLWVMWRWARGRRMINRRPQTPRFRDKRSGHKRCDNKANTAQEHDCPNVR